MRPFVLALRILGVVFLVVAGLHLTMGLDADKLLGSPVTQAMIDQPSFDAQNRFYGVCFGLLGVNLLIAATDVRRYRPIILGTLAVLFAAGIGRAVAWALHGAAVPALMAILVVDFVAPPAMYLWMQRALEQPATD